LVAIDLFSLSIVHGLCNGLQLQLIECIESLKNEVKRKMMLHQHSNRAPKSPYVTAQQKFFERFFMGERETRMNSGENAFLIDMIHRLLRGRVLDTIPPTDSVISNFSPPRTSIIVGRDA